VTSDLGTVLWKEWMEIWNWGGSRGKLGALALVVVFGVVLPWQFGAAWVKSPAALAYWGWVPMFLVVSVIADSFAGERERHTLETLLSTRLSDRVILVGKVLAGMSYGLAVTWISLLVGLLTLNLTVGAGHLLVYSPARGAAVFGLTLLASALAATAGVLVSLRAPTVRQAQQTLSVSIMLLLFVPTFGSQALPKAWRVRAGSAVSHHPGLTFAVAFGALLAVDIALLLIGVARFRRTRLLLD
jgi:ABC-2 type transport system permease protein